VPVVGPDHFTQINDSPCLFGRPTACSRAPRRRRAVLLQHPAERDADAGAPDVDARLRAAPRKRLLRPVGCACARRRGPGASLHTLEREGRPRGRRVHRCPAPPAPPSPPAPARPCLAPYLPPGSLLDTIRDGKECFPRAYGGEHVWEYFQARRPLLFHFLPPPFAAGAGPDGPARRRSRGSVSQRLGIPGTRGAAAAAGRRVGVGQASGQLLRSAPSAAPHALAPRRACPPGPLLFAPPQKRPANQADFNDGMQSIDALGLAAQARAPHA
jgi:hypothetical protein